MILAFLKEKKDMLKSYIEQVEDHTVNSSTISDGSKLIIEGSTFSVEYFSKLGSLIMNSTLRQELLDRADGGIEIQQYFQTASEIVISSVLNVILVAGDFLLNLSAFFVALYYNLLHEKDFIQNLFHDVIPLDRRLANEISRSISDTLEDIIMLPVHIGVFSNVFDLVYVSCNFTALSLLCYLTYDAQRINPGFVYNSCLIAMDSCNDIRQAVVESLLLISIWTIYIACSRCVRIQKGT